MIEKELPANERADMITLENRTVLHCKCEHCGYAWDSNKRDKNTGKLISELPDRCASCKYVSWNSDSWNTRDRDVRTNHYTVTPPGSPIKGKLIPQLRPRDLLEALLDAKGILEQLIADYGPCEHSPGAAANGSACVCAEKEVLAKLNRQIEALTPFAAASKNGRKPKAVTA